ncbi:MAG TPA: helix-hairpin-helix domain-containing protein [Usitatibacter sp.]|nr:helix-hairpin-helix domain-containing protein [Usitatibacter sp.]
MQRIFTGLVAALASLGLAVAGSALAQKAETPKTDAKKTEASAKPKAEAKKADAPKADAKKAELIDINTASEKELASLKGIGEVRAKAIVKGRPYKGKDELVSKKVVPQNVYDDIKDQVIAKQDAAPKKEAAPKKDEKKK